MADTKQYLDVTGLQRLARDFKEVFVEHREINQTLIEGSENPVSSGAVYTELENIKEEIKSYLRVGTKEFWDERPHLISIKDCVYFYTDYAIIDDNHIARMKIGDGETLLKDLPFIDELYYGHVNNSSIHVSAEDRAFWDNKVSAEVLGGTETLILSIN